MSRENNKVPNLRFPEFRGVGDWEPHKINDFIESYKGGASLTPKDFELKSDCEVIPKKAICAGGWLKINAEDVTYCSEVFFKKNKQSVVDSTYLITTLRDLVPSGPSIGHIVKYTENKKYILAQGVYGLKPKKLFSSDFLIHFSNTGQYRKLVNSVMVGSTQVHIRNGDFLQLPIYAPPPREQQKIADCLSSLDELITAQTQKLAHLKTHKKGLMQQLFPAEGETQPKLRFPEFRDAGDWEEKKLSAINIKMQSGLSRLLKNHDIGLPVIRSNNIVGDKLNISDIKYWYRDDPQGVNTENYFLDEGDLLVNFINSVAQIGKVALYENKLGRDVIITTNLMRLKFLDEVESKFIFYFFLTEKYTSHIHSITKPAVNQASFTTKDLGKLLIPFPTLPEQQKIADCLSSLDDLITAQGQKLAHLKTHKKGLMQQLFPAADEVNG